MTPTDRAVEADNAEVEAVARATLVEIKTIAKTAASKRYADHRLALLDITEAVFKGLAALDTLRAKGR